MTHQARQARGIQEQIRQILLSDWDPIGIRDVPEAQDEYDSYVGGVYRLLADGASAVEVAKHLARIEGEQMGLPSSADGRLSVATKLCGLNVKISNGAV
jgi:hypothetical protein